jgi:ketosteroid isomerase-like protein
MKSWLFCCWYCLVLVSFSFAQDKDETAVRNVLAQQTKQWNNGNIPAFMDTYWKSDSLMFIGKSGITYGWKRQWIITKRVIPDTVTMGKLGFDLLEVKRLSTDFFFVVGKWHLSRSIGDIGGVFTLLFRKINNKWVIVCDHSS